MEQTIKISLKGFNPRQKEIALDIINTTVDKTKYFIVRASRKAGKSWMLCRILLYFMIKSPNSEIGFISATSRFTKDFYLDFIKILPRQLIEKTNINEIVILKNGSKVDFYTAGSNILPVNRTFDYLLCDEFALYKKDVWSYIKPTVVAKKDAKVIITSTPRGKNEFFNMCMLGIEEKLRHKQYRMHYTDNPKIDLQQIQDDKESMPAQLFNQEYEAEFTEGISETFGDFRKLLVLKSYPEDNPIDTYFFGIDVAGVGDDDTVLFIMNQLGVIHNVYECESGDLVKQAEELYPIIKKYNAIGYCEKNGIGQGLADILRDKGVNLTYWNSSNESKQKLVTGLIVNINKNELQLPTDRLCPKLENQMSTYIGKRTTTGLISYNAEKGYHDDYVISLMLANEARKTMGSGLSIYSYNNYSNIVEEYAQMHRREFNQEHSSWVNKIKYK